MPKLSYFVITDAETGETLGSVIAGAGETLYDAATRSGISVRTSCRASSICGQCWVDVLQTDAPLDSALPDEAELLERYAEGRNPRLACRLRLPDGASRVEVTAVGWSRSD